MSTKLALLLMLTSLAVGQDDRIKMFISVTYHPENALVTQLGEELKQEFVASKKYNLVSSQAEADVHFAIIGVGAESYEYAAASALVFCTLQVQIRRLPYCLPGRSEHPNKFACPYLAFRQRQTN